MSTYKIAAVPGDGIGIEVIAAGVEVLQALSKNPVSNWISNTSTGTRITT